MVWQKNHDGADLDEKLHELREDPFDASGNMVTLPEDYVRALEARSIWTSMLLYSSRELTDGVISEAVLPMVGTNAGVYPHRVMAAANQLARVKLTKKRTKRQGAGWHIPSFLKYNPSKEQVTRRKASGDALQWLQKTKAGNKVRDYIRDRDANRCRYCYTELNYNDHTSTLGGTYDHVHPLDEERKRDPEWIVCACKFHNGMKQDRSPEEAGLVLLPPWPESDDARRAFAQRLRDVALRITATEFEQLDDIEKLISRHAELIGSRNTRSNGTGANPEPGATESRPNHGRLRTSGRDGSGRTGSGRAHHPPGSPARGSVDEIVIQDLTASIPHPADREDIQS